MLLLANIAAVYARTSIASPHLIASGCYGCPVSLLSYEPPDNAKNLSAVI